MVSLCISLIRRFCILFRVNMAVIMLIYRPVDTFVTYDGKRATDIAPPRYAVRHLVATEVSSLRRNW